MRPALLLVLIASLLVPAGSADAARPKRKPASCQAKAKKIKKPARRRAALKRCRKARLRTPAATARSEGGADDVTVVAVLDAGMNPYHWDFLSAKLPQHQNADPLDDVPLDRPATEWLPGFGEGLASFERIDLPLEASNPGAGFGPTEAMKGLPASSRGDHRAVWFPGTKIIGAMAFGEPGGNGDLFRGAGGHGVGTTSTIAGNIHGTCPECLIFFIDMGGGPEHAEAALEWTLAQPWIDVVSNSYGNSTTLPEIYAGSDLEAQRSAVERGQEILFSAGNGFDAAFFVSNPAAFSSQKGPDWILTVGAGAPGEDNHYGYDANGGSYAGAGKPVDVAGVGGDYPNAIGATTVSGTGETGFWGTSNAAPQIGGLYARSLYLARKALGGPSRSQSGGVIASGTPVACGTARPDCELGDGVLTERELRMRLLHGAVHSEGGVALYPPVGQHPTLPPVGEEELMGEGHGTYFGRQAGPASTAWLVELERVVGPMFGRISAPVRPAGEHEWFVVDSHCRQRNWGAWKLGYYVEGQTALPGPDPRWPIRSVHEQTCLGGATPLG